MQACDDLPKFGSLQLKISGNAKAESVGASSANMLMDDCMFAWVAVKELQMVYSNGHI